MNLHPCEKHGSRGCQGARALGAGAVAGIPRTLSAARRMSQAGAEGGRAVRGSVPGFWSRRDWSLLAETPEEGGRR